MEPGFSCIQCHIHFITELYIVFYCSLLQGRGWTAGLFDSLFFCSVLTGLTWKGKERQFYIYLIEISAGNKESGVQH